MQISLIRHGRSNLHSDFMNMKQFQEWLEHYDREGIAEETEFPKDTVRAIQTAKFVISSTSARAIQSAALLTNSLSFVQNPIFCDAALPSVLGAPEWIKLKPHGWMFVNRMLWLAGHSKEIESYEQARFRARQAVDLLIGYAHCYQKVALVGHGYFNSMIAKELKQRGWAGPVFISHEHWGCTTYTYRRVLEGIQNMGFTVS
ncbi:histidine phosphatase family protein [Ectobacillus panaciterrae]|uniref:histidine phosphatase family protein n=1 Tax=Ectobacillus panaciterrae TaxID=363872 RepID=UPI00041B7A4C|nr:histidine phosphatase family protein [Ectobacillus panaciterrae]